MLTQSEPDAEMLGTVPGKELEGLAGLPPPMFLLLLSVSLSASPSFSLFFSWVHN